MRVIRSNTASQRTGRRIAFVRAMDHWPGRNSAGDFPDLFGRPRPLTNGGAVTRERVGA